MIQRIKDNPHMPRPELEYEEVETYCEDWMTTTDPEGHFRIVGLPHGCDTPLPCFSILYIYIVYSQTVGLLVELLL